MKHDRQNITETGPQKEMENETPLNGPWRFLPAAVALFAFGVYLTTACPTVYMGDSGELTAAAFSLGVAHNSGYPLYVLLGKLFTLLPVGNIAFKVNLVSAVFASLAVWLVFSTIYQITSSLVSSVVGALLLAFAPLFWLQTSCSEVYAFHVFFVGLLLWLLWRWDNYRSLKRLALLTFVAGLSFGNHTQTVMLAPAILFIVISGDYKALFRPAHFVLLSALFLFALSLYLMLPVRTMAGAALHWGDPDTWERFLAHVTAQTHRGTYVFNKNMPEYFTRAKEIIGVLVSQFGVMLLPAAFGWVAATTIRWKIFFTTAIFFDLFYGLFLNIVSVEITPFGLPTCVVLAVLMGLGLARIIVILQKHVTSAALRTCIGTTMCIIPGIPLGLNYDLCDQSRNYMAYDHGVNILRTVQNRGTLFVDGDNNIFPVMYSRLVEGARPDMSLYDRLHLFFRLPQGTSEKKYLEEGHTDTYYAVFNPAAVPMPPGYVLTNRGILYKSMQKGSDPTPLTSTTLWSRYMTESMEDGFYKDFMNRQVAAHYHFAFAKHLMDTGKTKMAIDRLALASTVGYNDETIHLEIASYYLEQNDLDRARMELEKALIHHEDLSGVYNNWGYYYDKGKEYVKAIDAYGKAIALNPNNHSYYNNLGLSLLHAGEEEKASEAFQKSLEISSDQPKLQAFMAEKGLDNKKQDESNEIKKNRQDLQDKHI